MSRWSKPSLKWQVITDNARHYLSHLTQTFDILQLTQMLWRVRTNQRRGRRERRRGRRSSGCSGKVCVWVCARGFGLWPSSFLPSTPLSQARCEWAKKPKGGREQDRRGSQARTNKNKRHKSLRQQSTKHKTMIILTENFADEPKKAKPYLLNQVSTRWSYIVVYPNI